MAKIQTFVISFRDRDEWKNYDFFRFGCKRKETMIKQVRAHAAKYLDFFEYLSTPNLICIIEKTEWPEGNMVNTEIERFNAIDLLNGIDRPKY